MYMHALVLDIERDIIQGFLRPNYIIYRLKRSLIDLLKFLDSWLYTYLPLNMEIFIFIR